MASMAERGSSEEIAMVAPADSAGESVVRLGELA